MKSGSLKSYTGAFSLFIRNETIPKAIIMKLKKKYMIDKVKKYFFIVVFMFIKLMQNQLNQKFLYGVQFYQLFHLVCLPNEL